jgi:hypothetical protein
VRPLAEGRDDIRRWTEFPRGGHVAALQVPAITDRAPHIDGGHVDAILSRGARPCRA